jgi:hypothetical protein
VSLLLAPLSILLPESTLDEPWFVVLAGFVAVNTIVYVTLSIAKSLPRIYLQDLLPRRRMRRETRSIYPDGPR